jgi:hypothetical protein
MNRDFTTIIDLEEEVPLDVTLFKKYEKRESDDGCWLVGTWFFLVWME